MCVCVCVCVEVRAFTRLIDINGSVGGGYCKMMQIFGYVGKKEEVLMMGARLCIMKKSGFEVWVDLGCARVREYMIARSRIWRIWRWAGSVRVQELGWRV